MSVTSTSAAVSHTGNGVADTFAFTFKVFSSADLYVQEYLIATGALTALAITTDYTVSLTDGGAGGGSVTLVAGPLPATKKLIIQRLLDYTQETDFIENDNIPAASIEDSLDKCTMLIQQLKEELDRALLGSITTEAGVIAIGYDSGLPDIVAGSANKIIQINAGETDYELKTVSAVVTATINAAIAINTLTEKTACVDADLIVIEDSEDANARKKVQLQNLGIGGEVEVFTSDNTWTKPAGATFVAVHCIGGGGGGAGGQTGNGVNRCGGSGGGGGVRSVRIFKAADLAATEAVVIGTGGGGGASTANGSPGVSTTFGTTKVIGYGGGGGLCAAAATTTSSGGGGGGVLGVGAIGVSGASSLGGSPAQAVGEVGMGGGGGGGVVQAAGSVADYGGGAGGGGKAGGASGAGGASFMGGGGGGAGGGMDGGNVAYAAAAGGASGIGAGGAAGDAVTPTAGTAGTSGNTSLSGSGGGGGGSKNAGTGAAGGAGGAYGGGGGGGGASHTTAGGAGGDGGKGACIVYSW